MSLYGYHVWFFLIIILPAVLTVTIRVPGIRASDYGKINMVRTTIYTFTVSRYNTYRVRIVYIVV
jgi:hypothetical protein